MARTIRIVALITFALLATKGAQAQATYATISGVVTDTTGGFVPGVSVEVVSTATNYRYTTRSNEAGVYTLPNLLQGTYVLKATMTGFREFNVQDIRLLARDNRRIDVQLEVGSTEMRVEVSAGGGTVIETETARIADVKTDNLLLRLPMNSRSPSTFILLTPGVFSVPGQATIRYAGSRWGDQAASIDGVNFSTGWDGTSVNADSFMESFQEMRVDSANNSAEFGSFGQMTLTSKSGTNQFHGSAFDYYTTSGLNARNPFALTKGSFVNHSFGGSAGGPVVLPKLYNGRNRTFFFFSIETLRGGQQTQLINPTVAPSPWRSGDFSALPQTLTDPFAKAPFPGNQIPASRVNPVAQKIQDRFWPLPNFGPQDVLTNQNYRETLTYPFDPNTLWTPRIDHRFSDRFYAFGRYSWSRYWARGYDGNLPTIGRRYLPVTASHLAASATYVVSPTLINEFSMGRMARPANRHPAINGKQLVEELGLQGLAADLPDIQGIPTLSFAGVGLTGLSVLYPWILSEFGPQYQFQDNLTWIKGKHTIKAGAQVSRAGFVNGTAPTDLFGGFTFSNRYTNIPYGDFLLGIPTTSSRGFPPVVTNINRWAYDFFVQDDFKLRRDLTINIGLRYELHPFWRSTDGAISVFDIQTGQIVVPDGSLSRISPLMPLNYVSVVEAKDAGYNGSGLLQTDRNNLAPRIGVAYRPWSNRTVLRAGFGIFYNTLARNPSISGTTPFQIAQPGFTNTADPLVVWPQVYPESGSRPSTVSLPAAYRKDLRTPYSMQYSFTVEQERWGTGFRASFVTTSARQGQYSYNINQPLPDTQLFVNKPRLFPRYPAIGYVTNGAGHDYRSLVLEASRRYGNDLSYQFSYTLARDIGDLDWSESPENAYDRRREKAVAVSIPTHSVRAYFTYSLPFGRGKSLLSRSGRLVQFALGGWEVNSVFTADTGQFLTPTWTGVDPTGTQFTASTTPAQVTIRPNCLANPNNGPKTVNQWFDLSAFGPPVAGSYGTCSKGVIIGPGQFNLNAGLAKSFLVTDRARIRTEITATNVLNHANLGNPATNITAAGTVGTISGVQGGPRAVRLSLRVDW